MNAEQDYRSTLRRALVERCQRNPRYSMRAFARDLGFDPARLSYVLNGRRGLSLAAARSIARNLGFSETETSLFCDQVEASHGRSRLARAQAKNRLQASSSDLNSSRLTLDAFRVVSDWQHFAILQLLKLPQAKGRQGPWLARALGVKEVEVTEALERLERLELIEPANDGFRPSTESVFSPDGTASDAIKKFHEQILKKASSALFTEPLEKRDFWTVLLPFDDGQVESVRKKIRALSREILQEHSEGSQLNSVYSLSVQFVNLTSALRKENKL